MMRVAAVGDVHLGVDSAGQLRPALVQLADCADVLLLAGDLTRHGNLAEAAVVAEEFSCLPVPVIAVLGNHDYHSDVPDEVTKALIKQDICVLEGSGVTLNIKGETLGVAGVKGFGGGFAGKCGSSFGEREMKAFIDHTIAVSQSLEETLAGLNSKYTIALTHYSPITDTLKGEPPEIYPFLGSYLLAEAIDRQRVDLAIHGHAHFGAEHGSTPGGVRVRNVAQPVIKAAYHVYCLDK